MNKEKSENLILLLLSSAAALFVFVLGLSVKSLSRDIFMPSLWCGIAGSVFFAVICAFYKKTNKAAIYIAYCISFTVVSVTFIVNFGLSRLTADATSASRWLQLGNFALDSSAFLVLSLPLFAYLIYKYGNKKIIIPCIALLVPTVLVVFQPNLTPALLLCFSAYILVLKMNKDKIINVGIYVLILSVAAGFGAAAILIRKSEYFYVHLMTALGREGFEKSEISKIVFEYLGSSVFFGTAEGADSEVIKEITEHRRLELPLIVIRFGWMFFILYAAAMLFIVFMMFRYIYRMPGSAEKYISLGLTYFIAVKFIYAIVSQFFLSAALSSPPFIGGETSIAIDGAVLGIISSCFLRKRGNCYGK